MIFLPLSDNRLIMSLKCWNFYKHHFSCRFHILLAPFLHVTTLLWKTCGNFSQAGFPTNLTICVLNLDHYWTVILLYIYKLDVFHGEKKKKAPIFLHEKISSKQRISWVSVVKAVQLNHYIYRKLNMYDIIDEKRLLNSNNLKSIWFSCTTDHKKLSQTLPLKIFINKNIILSTRIKTSECSVMKFLA